jgi:peptidoglycan/LPS O-acetylase OafA/YrhL
LVSIEVDRPRTEATPTPAETPRPTRGAGAIPHFPGLEGLRGLAVVAVVCYHARYPWMRGGFLGVSTFFTLSGFLITSLLLNERGATGTIDLRQFWRRRFRRLMPAALAALALVVAFGWSAADAVQRRNLAGDVLAALGYVANWRFLLAHQSYADIFGQPSPVAHFWSLAIEEQFYLFLPLIAWFLLIRLRLGRRAFAISLALLTVGSLALSLFAGLSTDGAYYNTGTRAAELLIGALMAAAVFDRRVTVPLGRNRAVQVVVSTLGIAAFAVSVGLWTVTEQSGDASPWLYRGGFAAYSVLTALVILATVTPAGPVRWLLAQWPFRALGKISYGVYLYHWPIFLWLDERRTGLADPQLSAVRLGATLTLAVLSYNLLEAPIRHAAKNPRLRLGRLAAPVIAGLAVAVIAATVTAPKPAIDFDAASAELVSVTQHSGPPPPPPDTRQTEPPFPRLAIFGDSTAMMTGIGMTKWAGETKKAELSEGVARMGCGIGRGGDRIDERQLEVKLDDVCNRWELEFGQAIDNGQPNVAVVQTGPWEVSDRRLAGTDRWVSVGDPGYDRYLTDEMTRAIDVLTAQGAVVTWLTSPYIDTGADKPWLRPGSPAADPKRMDRLNELIRGLPAKRPGKVEVVDLAGWLDRSGDGRRLRPDGAHFSDTGATEVATRFLGDAVLAAFRTAWSVRAQRQSDGTAALDRDAADRDAVGRYLTNKYKVLIVGDRAAELVAAGLSTWSDHTGGFEVVTARESRAGTRDPTPPDCQSFRQAVLDAAKDAKPDLVLVVPSVWDLGNVRLSSTNGYATWGDAAFEKAATQHFQDLVRQLNDLQSVVLWANGPVGAPQGGPGAAAKVLPAADDATAQRYDNAVKAIVGATPRKAAQRVDLANWAAKNLPALRDGSELTVEAKTALGEWLGKQAYVQYDGGDKLKPVKR